MIDKKKKRRRFPTERQSRILERGADEYQNLLEHELRGRPRALKNARDKYKAFIFSQNRRLQAARRRSPR